MKASKQASSHRIDPCLHFSFFFFFFGGSFFFFSRLAVSLFVCLRSLFDSFLAAGDFQPLPW
jgi:hypothetical protein